MIAPGTNITAGFTTTVTTAATMVIATIAMTTGTGIAE
jgi:hypothetical protein